MRVEFDEDTQSNVVVLDGTECGCEQVVDACLESGAVHPEHEQLHVRFPGNTNEYVTRAELRKRILEKRNF